jgi:hypothetical protein
VSGDSLGLQGALIFLRVAREKAYDLGSMVQLQWPHQPQDLVDFLFSDPDFIEFASGHPVPFYRVYILYTAQFSPFNGVDRQYDC